MKFAADNINSNTMKNGDEEEQYISRKANGKNGTPIKDRESKKNNNKKNKIKPKKFIDALNYPIYAHLLLATYYNMYSLHHGRDVCMDNMNGISFNTSKIM